MRCSAGGAANSRGLIRGHFGLEVYSAYFEGQQTSEMSFLSRSHIYLAGQTASPFKNNHLEFIA
mgnify:FL=1|jgi:hypothetical protein